MDRMARDVDTVTAVAVLRRSPIMMSRFPSLPLTKRAVVVAALAAIGTVAWAGCGSGEENRYYCDSAGCYECDAYGCSGVTPPTKKACTGATSCDPGSVCTAAGCTATT